MSDKSLIERYGEKETIARRETALKRMLSTPHKPHKPLGKKPKKISTGKNHGKK